MAVANFIFFVTIFFQLNLFGALHSSTFVKLCNKDVPIKNLKKNEIVLSFDCSCSQHLESSVRSCYEVTSHSKYKIVIGSHDVILCTGDQLFYDPSLGLWISACKLTCENRFLTLYGDYETCISVEAVSTDEQESYCEIFLDDPHTFYISKAAILTHNFIPIVIGASFLLGEGVSLSGAGVAVGVLGLGLWHIFGKNNRVKLSQLNQDQWSSSPGGSPEDPDDEKNKKSNSVDKMDDFFDKTLFGREIRGSVEKTNKRFQGQTIYRVKEKVPKYNLKKGDQFYLDNLHKNHLEVFRKNNEFKTVLNLDGTINYSKATRAQGRKL